MIHKKKSHRRLSKAYRRRRRIVYRNRAVLVLCTALLVWTCVWVIRRKVSDGGANQAVIAQTSVDWRGAPAINVQLLTPNQYSRPQKKLHAVKGIVIHYTANPGTTAQANHNYFEGLKDGSGVYASSHFIVGLDGEVVQNIPTTEEAYASNSRNDDTISIETCHQDESGSYNEKTYASMVQLTGWLCVRYHLDTEDVIRHYDITGKICPKYFVDHEDAWKQFKTDVSDKIKEIKTEQRG